MKHGHYIRLLTSKIDYKQLRKINPAVARRAVLEYLKSNGCNIYRTASMFVGCTEILRCI